MQPRHYYPGDIIFQAGEPSKAVYVITEGEVEIALADGFEVARLHPGDLFGESGVLENRPRSATATAVRETTVLATDAGTFFHAFGMDNDRPLMLVKLLCRRLRDTSARVAHAETPAIHAASACEIVLQPENDRFAKRFGIQPIAVSHLPFQVGNRFGGEALPLASEHSCCIPDRGSVDLAAPHFEILRRDGHVGIRDMGSRWGTIVNGRTISRSATEAFAELNQGDNMVICGRPASPFRFIVRFVDH